MSEEKNKKQIKTKNFSTDNSQQDQDSNPLAEKANFLGMPYLEEAPKINNEVLDIISRDIAIQHKIIAFEKNGKKVKVGIVDPNDINALNILRFIVEKKKIELDLYLISEEIFQDMAEQYSGGAEKVIQEAMELLQDDADFNVVEESEKKEIDSMQAAPVTK